MIYRHHTKHYRYTRGRKEWSLFSKTSQSSWRHLLMKSGLEIKPSASFHHPHVKNSGSYRAFCSWAEQYTFILWKSHPQCQGGHKTAHLNTLFVGNYGHDKTSPSPGAVSVTVNLQVTCAGTNLASGLKLQRPLLARMFSKVVFNIFARNLEIRV